MARLAQLPARRPSQSPEIAAPRRALPKKAATKRKIEAHQLTPEQVIVSLSNLQKGLSHVQNGLQDMMNAYIKHTTSVIAGEDGALEALSVLPLNIAETAKDAMAAATSAVNNVNQSVAAATPAAEPEPGKTKKRKREKKEKDPNAPKRPLTAAFLYAQHARPIVKRDLESSLAPGAKLEPNAVNFEVNKRWNEMLEEDKEVSHPPPTPILPFF